MQLRRFKDIVAIKTDTTVGNPNSYIAFHASNMEAAEVSEELFNEMTEISLLTGDIPEANTVKDKEALAALEEWNQEINPSVKSGKLDFKIKSITLNVNQICNLKCTYCAAGGDGTYGEAINKISIEKTLPQLKFFISKLSEGETFSISFVGGEPLLHPDAVRSIYNYVRQECTSRKVNYFFKIVTNGTLLTGDVLNLVKSMRALLVISYDGINNDLIRPSKDNKSPSIKIQDALKSLSMDKGNLLNIEISAITSERSGGLAENYIFLKQFKPDFIDFVFENSESSPKRQQAFITGFSEIAKIAWDNGGEEELRKIRPFDNYFRLLDKQQRVENHCGAGKSFAMVDAKNRIYPCVWEANNPSLSIGVGEQIEQEKTSKYLKSLIELNDCSTCWARFVCGGGCMYINELHSGNKHKKNILFCERTRNLILLALMYYKLARKDA